MDTYTSTSICALHGKLDAEPLWLLSWTEASRRSHGKRVNISSCSILKINHILVNHVAESCTVGTKYMAYGCSLGTKGQD